MASIIRLGGNRQVKTVRVYVSGPRFILSKAFMAEASLEQTWNQFLAENGVSEEGRSKIYARTWQTARCKMSSGENWGWTAEINDPIGEFIDKFKRPIRKRGHYSVILCLKYGVTRPEVQKPLASKNSGSSGRSGGPSGLMAPRPAPGAQKINWRRRLDTKIDGLKPGTLPRPIYRSIHEGLAEFPPPQPRVGPVFLGGLRVNGGPKVDNDNFDDMMKIEMTAEEEEENFRRHGIKVENVKPEVELRFGMYSNNYLEKTQAEINHLKENGEWKENVDLAPVSSLFIDYLLRPESPSSDN